MFLAFELRSHVVWSTALGLQHLTLGTSKYFLKAKISDLEDGIPIQKDVLKLQIPMRNTLLVDVVDCVNQLSHALACLLWVQSSSGFYVVKGLTTLGKL